MALHSKDNCECCTSTILASQQHPPAPKVYKELRCGYIQHQNTRHRWDVVGLLQRNCMNSLAGNATFKHNRPFELLYMHITFWKACQDQLVRYIKHARTLSKLGGMALPPTPILVQSMVSPSSVKMSLPTTTPFSLATTVNSRNYATAESSFV
jgi:hypothetical protein